MKYLHKYIYKGTDQAMIRITSQEGVLAGGVARDEVTQHLECRYVSPAEAVVRNFEFHTHGQYPLVYRLPVHLEGERAVYFPEDATREELEAIAEQKRTQLMAFFDYNAANEDCRHFLYPDWPEFYVWDPKTHTWKPRQRGYCIGRMYSVPSSVGEAYYLRMLLANIPGPQSLAHLRTISGTTYATFRGACLAAGLLADDGT